jgi:transcriptional regulator with XRE-family HTH domain
LSYRFGFCIPAKPYKPPYAFSVTIGENYAQQMRTFADLAEKLKMPVEDLTRQCNGKVSPSKALVEGLAKELGIDEAYLERPRSGSAEGSRVSLPANRALTEQGYQSTVSGHAEAARSPRRCSAK